MSELRCRVGDLAYVVAPGRPADGLIVRCEKYIGIRRIQSSFGPREVPVWELDRKVPAFNGEMTQIASDDCLRPIRPSDEPDEILTLAGKPQEVLT